MKTGARTFAVSVAVLLLLAGCPEKAAITEGTVTDKNYYIPSSKPIAPARYEVCFTKDNLSRCDFVSKSVYDKTKVGDWFVLPS